MLYVLVLITEIEDWGKPGRTIVGVFGSEAKASKAAEMLLNAMHGKLDEHDKPWVSYDYVIEEHNLNVLSIEL